jgi:ribosomal protein S18
MKGNEEYGRRNPGNTQRSARFHRKLSAAFLRWSWRLRGAQQLGRPRRKKVCKFCVERIEAIPYRDVRLLQQFVAERGKITPRRLTGVCTTHQRRLTRAIKQARNIALLPFAARY